MRRLLACREAAAAALGGLTAAAPSAAPSAAAVGSGTFSVHGRSGDEVDKVGFIYTQR
ncbi:hypothetical protein [Streptomyces sp. NPDC047028]|uniref:hypothetical protein n=1 Tax=Streptomyces sp. NPDC047028 TaxID=3155793 RepID=UPI0033FAE005